ncbi:MAG: FtsX-like permease family protein, partial [Acidobacteria bacterium]|nr:FtsX-like permease family protein [Acidobacteriota bacterium]
QVLTGVASFIAERRHSGLLQVFGRLAPGATFEGAEAEMRTIAARLAREHPEENKGWSATVLPLTEAVLGPNDRAACARGAALALGIAALVLLIAGANVANILLARALDRRKEMAVRLALGASRIDIVRLLLLENFLVVAAGAGVALHLATWGRDLVLHAGWPALPPTLDVPIDARVFAFVVAVASAVGASFGLLPALQGSRPDLRAALAAGSGGAATRRGGTLRTALAAGQVALAAACLVAAGLFLESQLNAGRVDPGFERERMLVASFDLGLQGYDRDRAQAFQQRVVDEVSKIPGVTSAAVADRVNLIGGGMLTTAYLEGSPADGLVLRASTVGPGYFETMGTPIVAGRPFQRSDGEPGALGWAVVNETLAKKLWPGADAVGRRFRLANVDETWVVVGVAKDGRYDTFTEEPSPHLFMTTLQVPVTDLTLHVRTSADPAGLLEAVRREMRALDPTLPLRSVRTMPEVLDQAMWRQKLGTDFTIALAAVALGLAVLGVYGVMSCAVAERRREMGIRAALGARPADLLSLVIARGVRLTVAGLACGLTLAVAASRWLSGFLFGVEGVGAATLGATAFVLLAATLAASYFPAARAARSDPRETLRAE